MILHWTLRTDHHVQRLKYLTEFSGLEGTNLERSRNVLLETVLVTYGGKSRCEIRIGLVQVLIFVSYTLKDVHKTQSDLTGFSKSHLRQCLSFGFLNFLRFDVAILLSHCDSNVTCSLTESVFEARIEVCFVIRILLTTKS